MMLGRIDSGLFLVIWSAAMRDDNLYVIRSTFSLKSYGSSSSSTGLFIASVNFDTPLIS